MLNGSQRYQDVTNIYYQSMLDDNQIPESSVLCHMSKHFIYQHEIAELEKIVL
jgi:hypothetical protein